MQVINRAVALVKPKRPYLDWANSLADAGEQFTLEELRRDCTAILIPEYDEEREAEAFVKRIYPTLFEMELDGWIRDEKLWPQTRDYHTFRDWFEVEIHSMVIDASEEKIRREAY